MAVGACVIVWSVAMPSYEYECISCNMRFTVQRSIHEDNPPYCCSLAMRQVYGSFGISLKGKGWGKDA